jgi:hypothetical protein
MYTCAGAWVHNGDAMSRRARRRTRPGKGPGGGARATLKAATPTNTADMARWPALRRRRVGAARARNDSGHTRPDESSQGSGILGSKAERHNKRGLARLTSGSKKQWQDGGEEGVVEQRKETGGARLDAGEAEQHDAVSSRSGSYSAVAT